MRWFTSDLHFGHINIVSYCQRPFADVEEMNEEIIARWNRSVGPDDEAWVLGDLAMGKLRETVPLISRLNGHITLLCGNHDAPWKGRSPDTRMKYDELYRSTGMAVLPGDTVELTLAGVPVLASHFPYVGDSQAVDRHLGHRPVDQGNWLLHGHVHKRFRQAGRQINVGIDAWGGRLVSEGELAELIVAGPADLDPIEWTS